LVKLNKNTFFEFLVLHPEHEVRYCECYGRTLFRSIDFLCQELWCILCRYGQSQGHFPKGRIKMTVSPYFSSYLAYYLTVEGVNAMIEHRKEVEHHVQHKLL
jgi:hypothetical protein